MNLLSIWQEVNMKKIIVAIVCLFSIVALSAYEYETENTPSEAKYYDNAKVIRIKNVEGEGFVQRSYEEGYEEATPNLPLFDKDTVGTSAGRLSIYLGRLNYLRLDSDTVIELLSVPQLRTTDLIARIEKGAVYLDIENLDKEKAIEIQTPDCGIFLLDKGLYRINVDENSLTEIYVIEGIAEVAGQETSRNVRENQKIVMARGQVEERPYYFYASEKDDFDRWNDMQNREQGYARYGTARYLQSGYEDYEYEMSRSGRWSYMSNFNSYVWIPYFSNSNWMPYANGRWVYNPFYGYVWVSYDNCGWFTHHYGRWHWEYASGWYWIPAYRWSPAWVSWFGDNDYYGWTPLSWWNRPIIIINNHWDHNYNYRRGIPHHSRSAIIIRKNEISAANARLVAVSKGNLGQAGNRLIAYRGAAPTERVAVPRVSVINARGKTMTFKQNGIVSGEKYRITPDAGQVGHGSGMKAAVYKYNAPSDAEKKYTPRVIVGRGSEKKTEPKPDTHYRSKTSDDSSSKTRTRTIGSSNSQSSSGSKDRSGGSSVGSSSSSSSSSSSDSARAAKKKRDQAAYTALLRNENQTKYRGNDSGYAATSSQTERPAYRSYESQTGGNRYASTPPTYPSASASGSASRREAATSSSGYSQNSYSSSSYPPANRTLTRARSAAPDVALDSSGSRVSSYNSYRNNSSGSSNRAIYTQPSRSSDSSRPSYSAPTRSSGRETASTKRSSSTATMGSAKKRN